MKRDLLTLALFALIACSTFATHIKGGEITYKTINASTRTYEFTLTLYRDVEGVDQPYAFLAFGDSSCGRSDVVSRKVAGPRTQVLTYIFTHSYPEDGKYIVSFNEENRNDQINNINDGNSVQISFYIDALVVVDKSNPNNSFTYLAEPSFLTKLDKKFTHTTIGFDLEGDSLAFKLVSPKAFIPIADDETLCGEGSPFDVPLYKLWSMEINPFSGQLMWDLGAPNLGAKTGEFSFAVKVSEFRKINGKYVQVGYTVRDFQILVIDTNADYALEKTDSTEIKEYGVIDLSVERPLELKIRFRNNQQDSASRILEAYSELFIDSKASFETYDSAEYKVGKFNLNFTESLIRDQPYILSFVGTSYLVVSEEIFKEDITFILNPKEGKVFVKLPEDTTAVGNDPELNISLSPAFPNPVKNSFYLNTSSLREPQIIIYSASGIVVKREKLFQHDRTEIKRDCLPPGNYYYKVISRGKVKSTGKLIFE